MNGLVVWAHSYCRSTLAFYCGLGEAFHVPIEVYILEGNSDLRTRVGFSDREFSDMNIQYLSTLEDGVEILSRRRDWNHLFGSYQKLRIHQRLILLARELGCRVAIASESPCNMEQFPRRIFKAVYLSLILPRLVKPYVESSSFII